MSLPIGASSKEGQIYSFLEHLDTDLDTILDQDPDPKLWYRTGI